MAVEMTLVRAGPQPLAVVRGRIKWADVPAAMFPMMDKVWAFIRSRELTGHGHNVWLYRDRGDGGLDIEIGVQLDAAFDANTDVVASTTPAGLAAHTFHYGEYEQLPRVHGELVSWCREQGHRLIGVSWEVYGDWHDDAARRRTDVYHLCARDAEDEGEEGGDGGNGKRTRR